MNAQITTDFMNIVGRPTMSFNTNTATAWRHTRIRAVRVLDNTGSITVNGKLAAMRSVAENMIDTLPTDNTMDGGAYITDRSAGPGSRRASPMVRSLRRLSRATTCTRTIIALPSDGLHTQNRLEDHSDLRREAPLCASIKGGTSNPVAVFAIQIDINNADPNSALLQDRASPGNFQTITNARQTADAFSERPAQIF